MPKLLPQKVAIPHLPQAQSPKNLCPFYHRRVTYSYTNFGGWNNTDVTLITDIEVTWLKYTNLFTEFTHMDTKCCQGLLSRLLEAMNIK